MHIKDFDPYEFTQKQIEGVDVYYKNLPWSPCIHIYFQFSAGAFSDPVGKEGVAHFLEHLVNDGSPSLSSKKAVKEFSRTYMLNSLNAFTGHYRTAYIGRCLPEHFERSVRAMKELIFSPLLNAEDVEHERKIITEESWGKYRNERFLRYVKEISDSQYHGHLRERIASPLGWPDTIQKITREDIIDFHTKMYGKENLSILLVGAVESMHMDVISEILRDIRAGTKAFVDPGLIGKPKKNRIEKRGDDIGHITQQAILSISRAMSEKDTGNNEIGVQARALLYDVLHERLRVEHSLCYSVSVRDDTFRDYSETSISVHTSEEKIATAEEEIWKVIQEIIDGTHKERFDAVHRLTIDQTRSNERLSGSIIQAASSELSDRNEIIPLAKMLSYEEDVTHDDVASYIKKIFDKEYTSTEIILPSKRQG